MAAPTPVNQFTTKVNGIKSQMFDGFGKMPIASKPRMADNKPEELVSITILVRSLRVVSFRPNVPVGKSNEKDP
jgi:hypothetical protein